jgi:glycosyltransferase involved in cell wall biosynthesis
MKDPLISVIMPAYNAAPYIGAAIRSVQEQTWTEWELLVVDDGSTDDTLEVLRAFTDERIRLFKKTNGGVASARNLSLDHAKGAFIAFLDADDILPPGSLEARARIMLKDPEVNFVDGVVHNFDQRSGTSKEIYRPRFRGAPFNKLLELSSDCFFGCTWMYRRTPYNEKARFPLMTHAEELAFYFLIAREGLYDHTSEPVLLYRVGHNSAMTDLKGLEKGYHQLFQVVSSLDPPPPADKLMRFRSIIRKVMFKSYLKAGHLFQALGSWFHPTPLRK